MKNFKNRGFTFIEAVIVIAVIGIMLAVIFNQFSKVKNMQIIKGAVEDVMSVLDKARSQTLASLNSSEYGVHFETNRIIMFTGKVYDSNSVTNVVENISPPATISAITLTGGATELYFNRLSGSANNTGTITISIASASLTRTITISATGTVSMN